MEIVLYESGSRGGNFDYSRCLVSSYRKHPDVTAIEWIIPSSSPATGAQKILCNDRRQFKMKLLNRLNFVYRSLANPLILFRHLRSKSPQLVILNDFEQLTAIFWVPLYKLFLKQHHFAVVLHDPDRDAYPPSKRMSELSMKKMMSIMSLALFHEKLPDKEYYRPNGKTTYINVPHGLYEQHTADQEMTDFLRAQREGDKLISIVGNIRMEKNYEMAIHAVSKLAGIRLVIAGSPSSSSVDVDSLRKLAADLGVANRVIFVIQYLSEEAMSAVVQTSDIILLNYRKTFTSQSGIFNVIAPFKKSIVLSRTDSALANIADRFGIGYFVNPDDPEDLVRVLPAAFDAGTRDESKWNEYLRYASWENHVNIVIDAFKKSIPDAV